MRYAKAIAGAASAGLLNAVSLMTTGASPALVVVSSLGVGLGTFAGVYATPNA